MFYVLDRTTGQFLLGKPFVKVNWATGFDETGRPMRTPGIEPTKQGTLVYPAIRAEPIGTTLPSVRAPDCSTFPPGKTARRRM